MSRRDSPMRRLLAPRNVKTILSPAVYAQYLSRLPKQLHPRYQKLSQDHLVCIHAYSTHQHKFSFLDMNTQLRKGRTMPCREALIRKIQQALSLIDRDYSRKIYYRYFSFSEQEIRAKYARGENSRHDYFTSVSARNANFTGHDCNVLMRITTLQRSVPPAYIAPIAWRPVEEEFLYEPFAQFRVLRVWERRPGKFEIKVLEYPRDNSLFDPGTP